MRRTIVRFLACVGLIACAGCSTAPVADFLDFVAPGNGGGPFHRHPAPAHEGEAPPNGDPFLGFQG